MASNGFQVYVISCGIIFILAISWQMTMADGTSEDEYTPDYENEVDPLTKRHLGSIAAYSGSRGMSGRTRYTPYAGNDDDNILKMKRFLGTLARTGWFPRQFRGFVGSAPMNYQQKRHIGAVARLGWLPYKSRDDSYM